MSRQNTCIYVVSYVLLQQDAPFSSETGLALLCCDRKHDCGKGQTRLLRNKIKPCAEFHARDLVFDSSNQLAMAQICLAPPSQDSDRGIIMLQRRLLSKGSKVLLRIQFLYRLH